MATEDYTTEVWKPIVGFEALYEISDHGRVRSLPRAISYTRANGQLFSRTYPAKILKQGNRDGYRYVVLSRFRDPKPFAVQRLVCEAFYGPAPNAASHAAHLNGARADNRLSNLVWASAKENHQHKRGHGTYWEGANHPRARLSETDVLEIRRRRSEPRQALAAEYGVKPCTIQDIVGRRSWRNI